MDEELPDFTPDTQPHKIPLHTTINEKDREKPKRTVIDIKNKAVSNALWDAISYAETQVMSARSEEEKSRWQKAVDMGNVAVEKILEAQDRKKEERKAITPKPKNRKAPPLKDDEITKALYVQRKQQAEKELDEAEAKSPYSQETDIARKKYEKTRKDLENHLNKRLEREKVERLKISSSKNSEDLINIVGQLRLKSLDYDQDDPMYKIYIDAARAAEKLIHDAESEAVAATETTTQEASLLDMDREAERLTSSEATPTLSEQIVRSTETTDPFATQPITQVNNQPIAPPLPNERPIIQPPPPAWRDTGERDRKLAQARSGLNLNIVPPGAGRQTNNIRVLDPTSAAVFDSFASRDLPDFDPNQ